MKKLVIVFLILVCSVYFVSAAHIITTSNGGGSYSVDKDINFIYNITVNNTDIGQDSNITQVDITIPSSFKFLTNTDGTNAPYETFTNTSTILSWTNSAGYLINGSESKSFWFSANASTSGNYNLVITTFNITNSYSSNIAVTINEISCTQNWNCTNWSICINKTQTRNCVDLNNCDNETDKPIINRSCECVPDWQCTPPDWSECINGIQIRSCVDFNACGDNSTKPAENQSCYQCTPNWECTEWQPEKCPEHGIQTKSCTDLNNCGTIIGKPADTKSCTYKSDSGWLFIVVLIIIILMITGNIILIIKQWQKLNPKNIRTNTQPNKPSQPNQNQFPPK